MIPLFNTQSKEDLYAHYRTLDKNGRAEFQRKLSAEITVLGDEYVGRLEIQSDLNRIDRELWEKEYGHVCKNTR